MLENHPVGSLSLFYVYVAPKITGKQLDAVVGVTAGWRGQMSVLWTVEIMLLNVLVYLKSGWSFIFWMCALHKQTNGMGTIEFKQLFHIPLPFHVHSLVLKFDYSIISVERWNFWYHRAGNVLFWFWLFHIACKSSTRKLTIYITDFKIVFPMGCTYLPDVFDVFCEVFMSEITELYHR